MSCSLSLIIVLSFVCIVKRTTGLRLELTNVNFLRPNVKLVFTKILNVVQLFGKPTVVIVTVQPLYCCYCSTPVQLPIFDRNSAKTLRSALFRFSRVFNAILRRFQAIFETIPSDFQRLEHRNQRKTKRFASGRPNVGGLEPRVGLLLFTRPTVHQCCSPGPLLFCCYC